MKKVNSRILSITLTFVIIAEILSYVTFAVPALSPWVFGLVSIAIIVATARRLRLGIMILFAELIVGSLGKMFVLEIGSFDVTIRMVLWLVILSMWLANIIGGHSVSYPRFRMRKAYTILAMCVVWGIIWGIFRGNGLGSVFSDVNNYAFFLLILPLANIMRNKKNLQQIFIVISTALGWLAAKTLLLFYIFSHEMSGLQDSVYAWSRASRLAEITNIDPTALLSRIFMQSQIWLVFGFLLFASLILHYVAVSVVSRRTRITPPKPDKAAISIPVLIALLALFSGALVASFSRTLWLALGVSLILFCVLALILFRRTLVIACSYIAVMAGITIAGIALSVGVANIPLPPGQMSARMLSERASKFSGEAAVSSRWAQMRPLFEAISLHPVIGSGFGTSVTYLSQDPRVLKDHPDGTYTTIAFELGWLEMLLKLGIIGTAAYLFLLFQIIYLGYGRIQQFTKHATGRYYVFGGLFGLTAVVLAHGVSPYLNHPLGIGIVMLMTCVVDRKPDRR